MIKSHKILMKEFCGRYFNLEMPTIVKMKLLNKAISHNKTPIEIIKKKYVNLKNVIRNKL